MQSTKPNHYPVMANTLRFLATLILGTQCVCFAQEYADSLRQDDRSIIEPLPIIMYDTDIGLGLGGKVFLLNTLGRKESFDALLFWSTKDERWVRLAYSHPDAILRHGTTYPLGIDVVFDYDRYANFQFFGIGQSSPWDTRESYTKTLFEFGITASRCFMRSFIGQLGIRYRAITNDNVRSDGNLRTLTNPYATSTAKAITVFTGFRFDTRDGTLHPSKGVLVEANMETGTGLFSTVSYVSVDASMRVFETLFYPKVIFAMRAGIKGVIGPELPMQILVALGGNGTLRGVSQDRYIDRLSVIANAELRFPIIWRFGGIVGIDAGRVAPTPRLLSVADWAVTPVTGLRFYMDTFVVRADVGFGKETMGLYFNFGHVF